MSTSFEVSPRSQIAHPAPDDQGTAAARGRRRARSRGDGQAVVVSGVEIGLQAPAYGLQPRTSACHTAAFRRLRRAQLAVGSDPQLVAPPCTECMAEPPPASGRGVTAERHLSNIRQLTFEGGERRSLLLVRWAPARLQSTRGAVAVRPDYNIDVDGSGLTRVSNGKGRTTCGFFYPDGQHILYGSTFKGSETCPPKPDFSRGYVWPVYDTYDIYRATADGSGIEPLTTTAGYDAEATIAKDGTIVFTSVRDGDLEIYSMRPDGSGVTRLTLSGPYGGPFFSRRIEIVFAAAS